MPITTIVPHKDGGAWGYNNETNSWVPVDPQALQGSAVGNLARGAGLGLQQLQQGINELGSQGGSEAVQQAGQALQLQTQAARNAAPWTTALGMGVPDMVVGGAAALATGGMSVPEMLMAQALAGGLTGAVRPGDMGERVQNAALGAVFAAGGAGLGTAAVKGITAGLALGRSVTEGSVESTAQGVITGIARQQNAEARAAMAAADTAAPGAGSVGAARTGADVETAVESGAMNADEAMAAGKLTTGTEAATDARSEALGYKPAYWAGTPKGSASRLVGSMSEFDPRQPLQEIDRKIGNSELVNRSGAQAMGAAQTLDPVENNFQTLDLGNMAKARAYLNQGQEALKAEMPNIGYSQFRKVLESVDRPEDPGDVGEVFRKWIDKTLADVRQAGDGKNLTGEGFIRQIRGIGEQIGNDRTDAASREAFIELQNKLYDLGETATKQNVAAGPHGGDQTITGKGWAELRKQEQMYRILRAPGAVDPQGNINARTVLRAMARDPTSGGFGVNGPLPGSPQKDLWDLLQTHLRNDLGNTVPPTGVRVLGALGKFSRGMVNSQLARTGLMGAGAVTAANSIWGK